MPFTHISCRRFFEPPAFAIELEQMAMMHQPA
jgi:hypothetical protein